MALSSGLCFYQFSHKVDCSAFAIRPPCHNSVDQRSTYGLKGKNTQLFGHRVSSTGSELSHDWSFVRGSRNIIRTNHRGSFHRRKSSGIYASLGLTSSQIVSGAVTWGTLVVLPFYTLMVLAPKAELTKKTVESNMPYVALGLLYAYLLYLSWTPDTLQLVFAGPYWLPKLTSIGKLFSSEIALASVWIHLLVVDLFAARQVFHDGLEKGIETRHSVSLCLFSCPVGIITHFITKAFARKFRNANVKRL